MEILRWKQMLRENNSEIALQSVLFKKTTCENFRKIHSTRVRALF